MDARVLRRLCAAAALLAALPGQGQVESASCEMPATGPDPLQDRAGSLALYERLPRSCLQQLFGACQEAASRGLLDFGSAAACSLGYEALLREHFGGDFRELLAWWQAQQADDVQ